ncbi:protein kinase [Luteolibacter pohnpeiensis]|uniref:Protein kinase n=2 Tax=Luteolibacter pohnpeiensis TaxID=454153 RepID=A0A934VVL0_9BACT|nr:protein kinase [Luteolibacter pohnpeiensis]
MAEAEEELFSCQECGESMNVSAIEPFSMVECPFCKGDNLVNIDFGPYTLVRRLTHGGMSVVYVGRDNTLGREVALKILNETYSADERRILAFEEEARITASFSHPHVVKVFTTGRAFGRFFIAMELVPGGHFETFIKRRGKVPEMEMLPLSIQIAEGLEAAWQAGLIHRDVKPGNILLDAQGNAKIVDFGLALVTKGGKAKAEELWATPYYVPPETIEGQEEDFRSDIYSFGATLYHALAGVPSCSEETMATDVLREAKKKVVPLKHVAPHLSAEICRIVDRAMAYDPKDRFGSYREMISQLNLALSDDKAAAQSRKLKTVFTAVVAANLLIGLGFAAWSLMPKDEAVETPKALVAPVTPVVDTSANEQAAAHIAQIYTQAREALNAADYGTARKLFSELRNNAAVQEPTRTFAGVEVVLTAFLAGAPDDARYEARKVIDHLQGGRLADQELSNRLLDALTQLQQGGELSPPEREASDATDVTLMMIAGLEQWDLDHFKQAADDFAWVGNAVLSPQDHWVLIYQSIAASYRTEANLLAEEVKLKSVPSSQTELKEALEDLDRLSLQVQPNGPAALVLQQRRKALDAMTGLLQEPEKPEPVFSYDEMRECEAELRFDDATAMIDIGLKTNSTPALIARKEMSQAAARFMTRMKALVGELHGAAQLQLLNASEVQPAELTKDGSLMLGGELVGWDRVDADSLIDLYRQYISSDTTEEDRVESNFEAVSFAWLTGARSRAESAARRLSEESPSFRERWEQTEPARSGH